MISGNSTPSYILKAVEQIDLLNYLNHCDYLSAVYRYLKLSLDSYSYVQFSIDLGFSASNQLRLIIAGKRPLTMKAAERMVSGLGLKGFRKKYFLLLVQYYVARNPVDREVLMEKIVDLSKKKRQKELDQTNLEYLSYWYHPVIRELVSADDFDGTAEWVQQKLVFPLRLDEVKQSFLLLERLGMLEKNEQTGRFASIKQHIFPPPRKDSLAIARYHQQMLDLSKEAVTRMQEPDRTLRSLTIRLSEDECLILKEKIDKLLQETISKEAASGGNVFQLNLQLFPYLSDK